MLSTHLCLWETLGYETYLMFWMYLFKVYHFSALRCSRGSHSFNPSWQSVTPSLRLSHPHTSICKEKDGRLTDVQACTLVHTHTLTDTARHAWCKGEEILSPCGAPIRTPSPARLPLLRTRSICSALINQGSGGQGVATWNKAWSSHGVRQTTSWHLAKLFLSCGLTRPPSRLRRLLVFPLTPCVTRPTRRGLDTICWGTSPCDLVGTMKDVNPPRMCAV